MSRTCLQTSSSKRHPTDSDNGLRAFSKICRYPVDLASISFHGAILGNIQKYMMFAKALAPLVRNRRVLDLGTGSGVLSLICASLGASEVTAVDRPVVARLARRVLSEFESLRSRIEIVSCDAFDMPLSSEGYDIVISETIGYIAHEENIAAILARGRKLAGPTAHIIPRSLQLEFHPVRIPAVSERQGPFLSSGGEIRARGSTLQQSTPVELGPVPVTPLTSSQIWQSAARQKIDGVLAVFSASLDRTISISNGHTSCWPRCVIPFVRSHWLCRGSEMHFRAAFRPHGNTFDVTLHVQIDNDPVEHCQFLSSDIASAASLLRPATVHDVVCATRGIISSLPTAPVSPGVTRRPSYA